MSTKPLSDVRPRLEKLRAFLRAWWSRGTLAPGDLVPIDELERGNRTVLIERAARYGPIFKGLMEKRVVTCVVDLELGRRLLKEHGTSLRPMTIRIESMVPHGFMRRMTGDVHRRYRKELVNGVNAIAFAPLAPWLETTVAAGLRAHAESGADPSPSAWADALSRIASSLLVTVFFGARPGSARHAELLATYRRLGPHGVVWTIGDNQIEAFGALRELLRAERQQPTDPLREALLPTMTANGPVDETMLGNLIYMVELGRYDLRGLLRWISKYAAEHPEWLERIANEVPAPGSGARPLAEAFVLETLRMDQSERLMRTVERTIRFEGHLLPKGSLVRVCMWEVHKSAAHFPEPFRFDPARFLGESTARDHFSPFGLDHHHCPLASLSIDLATLFVAVLARDWTVRSTGAMPPVRGPYHWEPSPRFQVTLAARRATSVAGGGES